MWAVESGRDQLGNGSSQKKYILGKHLFSSISYMQVHPNQGLKPL